MSQELSHSDKPETSLLRLPTYLLKTELGRRRQEEILKNSTVAAVAKDKKEKFVSRLSTLGVLGVEPQLFAKDEEYTDELAKVFRERVVPATQNTNEDNSYQKTLSESNDDGVIDAPVEPPIYLALTSQEIDKKWRIPLPTSWVIPPNSSFEASPDGTVLSTKKRSNSVLGATVRIPSSGTGKYFSTKANHGVAMGYGVYYYEVEITSGGANAEVSIGFMMNTGDEVITNLPGHEAGTFGYNGKDGKIISNQNGVHSKFGAKFGNGDIIGCGVNFMTHTIFYTKNGIYLGEAFSRIKNGHLIPIIGMGDFNSVKTNFGFSTTENFVFDIDSYVQTFKNKIFHDINLFTVPVAVLPDYSVVPSTLASVIPDNPYTKKVLSTPLAGKHTISDDEISTVLNGFIESYFDHKGYNDSAKAFAEDLQLERDIFEGHSNDAVMTDVNQDVCIGDDTLNRQNIRRLILDGHVDDALEMIDEKYPHALEENESVKFELQCLKLLNMISESTKSSQKEQLILQAAEYGRYLQEQYEHNESLVSYLHDISSLLAFENPKDSSHWYLLDSVQKQKVLNDLNKALLARLGKPTDSVFKQIIQHIKLALSLMVEPHRQQSSFINVEEDFLDI